MIVVLTLIVILGAYGLGSLSFSYIITKKLTGEDIRTKGSGNAGFTNAMRVLPKKWGALVFVLDLLKGMAAVLIGRLLLGGPGAAIAMLFVVIGHMYPFWMQFRGGKGIMAGFGAVLMFDWRLALVLFAVWAVVLLLTNYVSAGSIIAALGLSVAGIYLYPNLGYDAVFVLCTVLIIYKHRPNIERIFKGTESKVFKNRTWSIFGRR